MAKITGTDQYFDPEFHFLLAIDSNFKDWQLLAAQWYAEQKKSRTSTTALCAFFVRYLHAQSLDKRPAALFDPNNRIPDLWMSAPIEY
jgi:hypothetical protein